MMKLCLIQAIKCKLAYIEPSKRSQWSKKAKEKFEEKTQDKFVTCSVISKISIFVYYYYYLNKINII